MYPSLKAPVIGAGSELMPLNLTALHRPRGADTRGEPVLRTCSGGVQDLQRRYLLQRRQVQKAGNAVDVEQVELVGTPAEADRNHRRPGEQRVLLPSFQR